MQFSLKFDQAEVLTHLSFRADNPEIQEAVEQRLEYLKGAQIGSEHSYILNFIKQLQVTQEYKDQLSDSLTSAFNDHLGIAPTAQVEDILCFCTKTSITKFSEFYQESNSDITKVLFDTGAGGVCGNCRNRLKALEEKLIREDMYLLGKLKTQWIEIVDQQLEDFYLFASAELSKMDFEVIGFKGRTLRIRCDKKGQKVALKQIVDQLGAYLFDELDQKIDLKVVV